MVTVVAGIASAKVAAVMIGPNGVGLIGLTLGVSTVVASAIELGLATAVVRAVGARGGDLASGAIALGHVARRLIFVGGALMLIICAASSPWLTRGVMGSDRHWWDFVLACTAGVPIALTALENGLMVSAHRVRAIATTAVSVAFVSPVINAIWYSAFDIDGVAPGTLSATCVVFVLTAGFRRRELRRDARPMQLSGTELAAARSSLLRDGVPIMVSALIGSFTLLALPIVVADRLGREGVGYYRAANVISIGYTVAIASVISSDFLPRVSKVAHDAHEISNLVIRQVRLLTSVLVPLLTVVSVFLPLLVRILYTGEFTPTVTILEWQLVGDIFRMCGSVLATAVFIRFGGGRRLATEAVAFLMLVALSWVGLVVDGARGLGWGFLVAYVLYVAMLSGVLQLPTSGHDRRRTVALVVCGAVVCCVPAIAATATGDDRARLIGLVGAVLWLLPSAVRLRRSRTAASTAA